MASSPKPPDSPDSLHDAGEAGVVPKIDGRRARAEGTRAALQAEGRRLFGELGYEATALGDICAAAGATTGALYHHFGDKKGLFAAVAEALDAGLVALAADARNKVLARDGSVWDAFLAGIDAFLMAGGSPGDRRIGLTDAPAVLGADGWLAIRERQGLGAMTAAVRTLQSHGLMQGGDTVRLARIILGLLYGAVEALPTDRKALPAAQQETRQLVHTMLQAMQPADFTPAGNSTKP